MTDVPNQPMSVPSRLGATARYEDGELIIDTVPQPQTLRHGVLRGSVLSFALDAVAGITLDQDPDAWALTTDMTLRMRPVPAPRCVSARTRVLREGRRSATCKVDMTAPDGSLVATGAVGFARVARKPDDPPKPIVTPEQAPMVLRDLGTLSLPLRAEAGIEVVDAAEGVVEVEVTPRLLNPAGTLQGAMVALLAEAAAEDLVEARFGEPAVVVDLDLRYLGKVGSGRVRTRCRLLGDTADSPVEVELVEVSSGDVTTLVHARAVRPA
ncbi:MAG TPA: hypothetical protein VKZ55_03925 [Microthrixaceae bacterium]|nr:hypothetical protein [Microthrixaceae bacterium]